jgi:glyoxylase-like metal-dependent hydrolase (beta-lactamase superfamily II)
MKIESTNETTISRRAALKLFGAAGIAASAGGLLFANSTANAQQQTLPANAANKTNEAQGAGFYQFKVGELECFVISDGYLKSPPIPTFAANAKPAEVETALREYFLPTDQLTLQVNALAVKSNNRIVLIDTGSGNSFGATVGRLPANLRRAGILPEAVTDVVFTHAHIDHAGGNTDANGKLVFPNARYHIAQAEWETWTAKNVNLGQTKVDDKSRQFFIETTKKNLAVIKDRVTIFKPGAEIVTNVSSVPAVGHTPGHTAYLVASGSESVLHAGDFAHHFALQVQHPEWFTAVDFDSNQAVATRKKLLDRAAADRTLIVGSHMPFPGVGHIRARNNARTSYEWIPVLWQWQG